MVLAVNCTSQRMALPGLSSLTSSRINPGKISYLTGNSSSPHDLNHPLGSDHLWRIWMSQTQCLCSISVYVGQGWSHHCWQGEGLDPLFRVSVLHHHIHIEPFKPRGPKHGTWKVHPSCHRGPEVTRGLSPVRFCWPDMRRHYGPPSIFSFPSEQRALHILPSAAKISLFWPTGFSPYFSPLPALFVRSSHHSTVFYTNNNRKQNLGFK